MNDRDPEWMEAELRRLKPAPLPQEFAARLAAARHLPRVPSATRPSLVRRFFGAWRWGWLVPVTAAAALVVGLALWRGPSSSSGLRSTRASDAVAPAFKAADVEIGQQLIAAFDTVAEMPVGQPIRFRCREWMDEVVFRDSAYGVEIQQRTPRLEIVPVRYETY